MAPWNAVRAKIQIRLALARLQTLREKKEALAKVARRDIATLIEKGKLETARIKVETLINDDIYVELLEVLELYTEILLARFGLLENSTAREPDEGVKDSIISIVYAAPHTEVKELNTLRDFLTHRFGRDWTIAVMENKDECVKPRISNKVSVPTPSAELVDAYMEEISKGYRLAWRIPRATHSASADVSDALEATVPSVLIPKSDVEAESKGAKIDTVPAPSPGVPDTQDSKPPIFIDTKKAGQDGQPDLTYTANPKTDPPAYKTLSALDTKTAPVPTVTVIDSGKDTDEDDDDEDGYASLTKRFAALKSKKK